MSTKNILREIKLYYNTFRHLTPKQIVWRFLKKPRKLFFAFNTYYLNRYLNSPKYLSNLNNSNSFWHNRFLKEILIEDNKKRKVIFKRVENVLKYRSFCFLNETVTFKKNIDWQSSNKDKLWRYNLHYFDYLVDIGLYYKYKNNKEEIYLKTKNLIYDWIKNNKPGSSEGWEPYPLSLRIVNWIKAFYIFKDEIFKDNNFSKIYLSSIFQQIDFLSHNFEYDLMANHIFENIRSLLIGGLFFKGKKAEKWRKKAFKMLHREMQEQILEDGGHFERSPMYHCIVLKHYLDCLNALPKDCAELGWMKKKAEQMLIFLENILTPIGNFPLFNDSAFSICIDPESIQKYAEELINYKRKYNSFKDDSKMTALESSGFFKIKKNDALMFVNGGQIKSTYQPGHIHCDIFSYELFVHDRPFIIDSGTHSYYKDKNMREYCRSTRAHNTIMIDGEEQHELWKTFRIGTQAKIQNINCKKTDQYLLFSGKHTGYLRLGNNIIHERKIGLVSNTFWLLLDRITGKGTHKSESFIHLHPDFSIHRKNKNIIEISGKGEFLSIVPFGEVEVNFEHGWYCPEFGKKQQNEVIKMLAKNSLPYVFGYLIIQRKVKEVNIACKKKNHKKEIFTLALDKKTYILNL